MNPVDVILRETKSDGGMRQCRRMSEGRRRGTFAQISWTVRPRSIRFVPGRVVSRHKNSFLVRVHKQSGRAMRSRHASTAVWAVVISLLGELAAADEFTASAASGGNARLLPAHTYTQSFALVSKSRGKEVSRLRSPPPKNGIDGRGCANTSSDTCHMSGDTQVFTDRAAFIGALATGADENEFEAVSAGASGGLTYSSGGFTYLLYTQIFAHGALYNGPGFVSTDRAGDKITIQFSNNATVTAIGANFWPVDFSSRSIEGTIGLVMGDGTQETIQSMGPQDFRGFITELPIQRMTIDAPDIAQPPLGISPNRWPAMDNLIIGNGR